MTANRSRHGSSIAPATPWVGGVLFTVLLALGSAQAAAPSPGEPDPLAAPITWEVTGRPLSESLRALSEQAGCQLRAEPDIERQRVTLRFRSMPLREVMEKLAGLLSHSPDKPDGYRWYRERTGEGRPARYLLRRDRASREAERRELEYPARRSAQLLAQVRTLALTPPGKREALRTELNLGWKAPRWDPHLRAVASLTGAQVEALARGQRVPLRPELFAAEEAQYQERMRQISGRSQPFTPSLRFRSEDVRGDLPFRGSLYFLQLSQAAEVNPGWDVYQQKAPNDYASLPDAEVDLRPLLTAPQVTRE